jgi:2-polyprenyl-6-methoxyphenol hydroxylase-like FAD-dependent oxidoreductase
VLSNGEEISVRLVVLANGLNVGVRQMLGITRHVISECHSVTLGLDVEPVGRAIDNGLSWRAQRWARFIVRLAQGISRSIRQRLSGGSISRNPTAKQPAHPAREGWLSRAAPSSQSSSSA